MTGQFILDIIYDILYSFVNLFYILVPIHLNTGINQIGRHGADHVHTAQDNIDCANMWFRINGVREVTYDEAMSAACSKTKVEREIER